MSEIIRSALTEEYTKREEKVAALEEQLSKARAENARLERYLARKEGIIIGLAYAIRCNGVSGNEIGGIEE